MSPPRALCAAALLGTLALSSPPLAAPEGIGIELNRLEDQGSSCRAYLVIANPGEVAFSGFKLNLAPLRSGKTNVKVFDIVDTGCGAIGSVLVNDVLDCRDADGNVPDCVQRVSTSSKLAVSLSK